MPISSPPSSSSDETSRPEKAIFDEPLAQRLHLATKSDEPLIRESAKNVLEAEALLSTAFDGVEPLPPEAHDLILPTTNEASQIMLKPDAAYSSDLPEHDKEMAQWDALYELIRSRLLKLRVLH